jgi:hypothetical protein
MMKETDWAEHWQFEGIALIEDDYHIWGTSPIEGDDGRSHQCPQNTYQHGARWNETRYINSYQKGNHDMSTTLTATK